MGLQDLIITPFYFLILLIAAYSVRPALTNSHTRSYFIPGLLIKYFGAIALGLVFQFYYGGGDTFTFHTHGSRWIWKACIEEPEVGFGIFFSNAGQGYSEFYNYVSHIWMYRDEASWFIIRIAAFFDLFTFSTYSATALFFASFAFSGGWALYIGFYKIFPQYHKGIAICVLLMPSVVIWGSGLLKDSITLGALGWVTYAMLELTTHKNINIKNILILIFFSWVIFSIKIYILLCFLVAASAHAIFQYGAFIKNPLIKIIATPFIAIIFSVLGFLVLQKVSEDDDRYSLGKIAQTAAITAYDIRYGWGARNGENSGYDLGIPDGSFSSFISLAPKGIIVTLFRPWPWEARNILMIMAAIESMVITYMTVLALFRSKIKGIISFTKTPIGVFCLTFSLIFAFAVGVSTANFGTLMRYKIPVIPIYMTYIYLLSRKKFIAISKNN